MELKIIHVLGQNAVFAENRHKKTCILVGKGIGFQKTKGDPVNKQAIQQVFVEISMDELEDDVIKIVPQ